MLPESTTTMGEEESVVTERPFQSMNAVLNTKAKFSTWVASWRGWRLLREENIFAVGREVRGSVCEERCCLVEDTAGARVPVVAVEL